jgi:hypothetical protein
MTPHTSGPWSDGGTDNIVTAIVGPGGGKVIARVYTHTRKMVAADGRHKVVLEPDAEGIANARLIAAAPLLLAALERITESLTTYAAALSLGHAFKPVLDQANAAIAAATGEPR